MQRGQQLGPFVIEKELGAGAMGAVYRAKHTQSGVRVAIKVMAPGLMSNKVSLDRFQREAAILKQLKHPNIVRLLATGKYQGAPFYAMEYVQGESLDHVMARRGRITWEEVVTLGQQLCSALQHVHDRGIVHRDLKPSNIMVLPDDTVKLTDFGIAKDLDVTALTAANCTVGTASYMSPEQCRGERDITHRSDLYSMGVMFYELITGRKPFFAESAMEMFTQHVSGTFERPSRIVFDLPVWLDTLIVQLMEKKPEDRPLSAAAVAEALGRIKERVEAQQSAGAELVSRKDVSHPKRRHLLDEEDKDAAFALMGKKRRKKKTPIHQQYWFQAVGLLLLLLFVGSVFYGVFLRTPSADDLYARARDLMASPAKWKEAREGPIYAYLRYYPDRKDDQAQKVQRWADMVDMDETVRAVENRLERGLRWKDDTQLAVEALQEESEGKLNQAKEKWYSLARLKNDPENRGLGLLAEEALKELTAVDAETETIRKKMRSEDPEKPYKGVDKSQELIVEGFRAEDRNDPAEGRKYWRELKEMPSSVPHRWQYLLAAKKLHDLEDARK